MTDILPLFPYQTVGASFLATKDQALLADEPGLGKSAQAIAACDSIGAQNILVICPANLRINWSREFWRFSPLDRSWIAVRTPKDEIHQEGVVICSYDLIVPFDASKDIRNAHEIQTCAPLCLKDLDDYFTGKFPNIVRARHWDALSTLLKRDLRSELSAPNVGVSYFLACRDIPDAIQKYVYRSKVSKAIEKERHALIDKIRQREWDVLILDEAHYLKNRDSQRTKILYGNGQRSPGIKARAKRTWRLTGTPAPNGWASELWTHLFSAGITRMPYWDFVFHFSNGETDDYKYTERSLKNTEELKKLLAQFMLRRKKEEVLKDLPPIVFQEVTVEKSPVELDPIFYEQIRGIGEDRFLSGMAQQDNMLRMALEAAHKNSTNNKPATNAANVLESMAPSLVTLRRYLGMQKLPAICDILAAELESEMLDKVVIFAVHQSVIEGMREKLRKFGAVTLYGNTPPLKRQENVDKFQSDPKTRVFIGNIQAAGVGITLTSACNVAFAEADWVPANNAQAAMRCHRIGQKNTVRVRFFTCADTVDEQIQKTLLRKTRELAKIF
jgi:SWI/SNF-related matrix-associated actin-dependent regulator of chromatin subfamily A-like protein 1